MRGGLLNSAGCLDGLIETVKRIEEARAPRMTTSFHEVYLVPEHEAGHPSRRSISSTRNLALSIALAAAAIARGDRPPFQSAAKSRAAKIAAAMTIACVRSCLHCSTMKFLRRGWEVRGGRGFDYSAFSLSFLSSDRTSLRPVLVLGIWFLLVRRALS